MLKFIIVAGALLVSAAASAQSQRSAPESSSGNDNSSQMICRSIANTETRLSRTRVCRTRAEWTELRRGARNGDRAQTGQVNETGGE